MKILIIDESGNALDWALRCLDYGHEIRWFISNKKGVASNIGRGLVNRVPHWEPHMKWADLIFTTDNLLYLTDLQPYFRKGFPIFGCNDAVAEWELDRDLGQKIFEKAGIETIPTTNFTKYKDAIAFVEKTMGRYVSKPIGDADKAMSYCSKSAQDMIYMLERWEKKGALKHGFILQEFVGGIEMAVGGWMGSNGFSKWFCENWEFKKLMNDDKGVATGEQGTVLRYTKESKLADIVLKPLEDYLKALNYTGYIDVNCIIDKTGTPLPLEFTTRPGWPLFQIQQSLHKGDPAQWMLDLIDGTDTLDVSDKVAVGVAVSQPPYPYNNYSIEDVTGIPVYNVDDSSHRDNIHPYQMMLGQAPYEKNSKIKRGPHLVTAGVYILICSGTGYTVSRAKERAYKVVDTIEIPNSPMWRTDIGCRLEKQIPELQKMGYVSDMEYE